MGLPVRERKRKVRNGRGTSIWNKRARNWARRRGQQGGSEGSRAGGGDGKPESQQDGDGHQEGHDGDAVAQGVDDPHRGEVRFLGRAEMETVSAAERLGEGKPDDLAGDAPWGPRQAPSTI